VNLGLHQPSSDRARYLAELADELSTHSAGTGWWADISGNGNGPDIALPCALRLGSDYLLSLIDALIAYLDDSRANRHPLSTRADRVRRVLDVGTLNNRATS